MKISLAILILLSLSLPCLAQGEEDYILEQRVAVGFKPEKAALILEERLGEIKIKQANIQETSSGAEYLFASSLDKGFSGRQLAYSFFIIAGQDNFAGTEIAKKKASLVDRDLASIDEYEKELTELELSLGIQKENLNKLEQNIEIVNERIAVMTGTKSLVDLERLVEKKEEYREMKEQEIVRLKALVLASENLVEPEGIDKARSELDQALQTAALATVSAYLKRERRRPAAGALARPKQIGLADLHRLEGELAALRKKRAVLEEALRE